MWGSGVGVACLLALLIMFFYIIIPMGINPILLSYRHCWAADPSHRRGRELVRVPSDLPGRLIPKIRTEYMHSHLEL